MFIHYFPLPSHLGYSRGFIFRVTLESGCGRMSKLGLELGPERESLAQVTDVKGLEGKPAGWRLFAKLWTLEQVTSPPSLGVSQQLLLMQVKFYIYIYTCYMYMLHICYMYWRRQWHPTLVLLPGKSHGWRSLGGCSPWGRGHD